MTVFPPRTFSRVAVLWMLLWLLAPVAVRAQQQSDSEAAGRVRGVVVEAASGTTLPGASVALRARADSAVAAGATTDATGQFVIENVPAGRYTLEASFVGYESATVEDVTVGRGAVELGEVALRRATQQLDDVEVTAEREYMEIGPEMTTYSPQNQPVLTGGSALNVLETIPSIQVDIEGNISYRGSQGVAIHLNGNPTPLTGDALTSFLEGLSSNDIERVEVIPNPSAKYNPEGTGGIINVVLADDAQLGWSGSLSAGADTRGRYRGSANAQFGRGPWTAYATYSARYDRDEETGFRYRENRYLDPTTYLEQDRWQEENGLSNAVNMNVRYTPSEGKELSLSAVARYGGEAGRERGVFSEFDGGRDLTERYDRMNEIDESDFSMDYELQYTRTWEPREHEFSLEVEFETDREGQEETYLRHALPLDGPTDVSGALSERQEVDETDFERELSLEADYQRSLGESLNLEAGYDGQLETQNSDYDVRRLDSTGALVPDAGQTNTFTYTEHTHAPYATLSGQLGDFGAQLGVRAEGAFTTFNQQTLGEATDNQYFSLFPSVHLSYQPGRRNTVRASYSKRVRRPSTWQLNPFGSYDDPTFRRVGNPTLTPEYTHSFEVGYTRLGDKYTLSLAPYYRYTVDEISWNEQLTEDGVTILTFENFDTESSYGAELVGSLTLGERFKGNASFNAYKQVTDGSNLSSSLSSDAFGFQTRGSVSARLGWGVSMQAEQYYRAPMDLPGGREDSRLYTNIALQKKLMGDRLTLNVRMRDLFGDRREVVERQSARYYREFTRESNSRGIRLTLRYALGGGGGEEDRRGGRRRGRR